MNDTTMPISAKHVYLTVSAEFFYNSSHNAAEIASALMGSPTPLRNVPQERRLWVFEAATALARLEARTGFQWDKNPITWEQACAKIAAWLGKNRRAMPEKELSALVTGE